MLADAQRIAEEAASKRPDSTNFAHLLELVKEFSTDVADCTEQNAEDSENATMVSMNAEEFRLDDDDEDERDLHLQKLKAQVAGAKTDLARSSAAALRAEPDSDSSDDESDSDAEESDLNQKVDSMLPKPVDRSDGYWTSSKTGLRHHISWDILRMARPGVGCEAWQAVRTSAGSLTLRGTDGRQHVLERLQTGMLGEALLWNSGELWTRQR